MTMIRKHAALLVMAAAFLVGCQDSRLPTDAEPGMLPRISDGADRNNDLEPDGNPHFFFLPPMVPNPDIPETETFNPALTPQVFICESEAVANPMLNRTVITGFCSDGGTVNGFPAREFGPFDAPRVEGLEHYIFHWQTVDFGLHVVDPDGSGEVFYRVFVVAAGEEVGFADVDVAATSEEMKAIDEALFVPLFIDRTLPVKFFVGTGFVCAARAARAVVTECSDGFSDFTPGSGADVITLADDGVQIPDQGPTFEVGAITLIITPCDDLPIDNPRFGPCLDFETFPKLTQELDNPAVVFICSELPLPAFTDPVDVDHPETGLTYTGQEDFITVHHFDENSVTLDVEALPHAAVNCEDVLAKASLDESNRLFEFASAGWSAVRDAVTSVFAPDPLYARMRRGDIGPGGLLGSFSQFQGALPAQMSVVPETDYQVADAGSEITVRVRLSDPGLGDVWGARVRCLATLGDGSVEPVSPAPGESTKGKSGNDGIAEFLWILGDPGDQKLECSGFGIAGDQHAGPFMPPLLLPPELRLDQIPVPLALGKVTFSAFACNNFNITADGTLEEPEWNDATSPPSTHTFTANLSKGSKALATVKVMNDCDNLYVALTVERPEADDVNVLRVDFDNDGDGAPDEGDDVWKLEAIAGGSEVIDGFLTSRCFRGGKQAECFTADTVVGGVNNLLDGVGAASHRYDAASGLSVYEFKVALNSGDTRSSGDLLIDVGLKNNNSMFGMFFTLSQSPSAKGAKGNTQWPGFRLYLECTTATPTASGSELTCTVPQEQ